MPTERLNRYHIQNLRSFISGEMYNTKYLLMIKYLYYDICNA